MLTGFLKFNLVFIVILQREHDRFSPMKKGDTDRFLIK